MKLTIEEVEHIADLARLCLTDEEKEQYCYQLSAILEYATRLQTLDTSGIPPTSSVLPEHAALREDVSGQSLPVDVILSNAPSKEKNQFRIPPVFE